MFRVLGLVLTAFLLLAGNSWALGLGSQLSELKGQCALEFKGIREGLEVYSCGWSATPAGERYTGIAVDRQGVVQEIVLVNGDEGSAASALAWLTSAYGQPERVGRDYLYWTFRGFWIVWAPRDGRATAIEISTRNPTRYQAALVTYRPPGKGSSSDRNKAGASGGRYQWDARLGGKNGNGSQCRDTVTGKITKEANCN